MLRTYVEWLTELPGASPARTRLDIDTARRILDEDHYDLEQIKDRILDYLAVRKLRGGSHGPILCFLGPPGVGKTSLGRSIARAMGRKFVRISLGGVRDEAEIRGHRRTYVGALAGAPHSSAQTGRHQQPGPAARRGRQAGRGQPRDPSAALLEVLDPEQNHTFRDHYLGVSFDLSKVLFIATANQPETIPPPLRDRMETLRLSGYAEEEKLVIAERYIIPKQIAEAGLTANDFVVSREVTRRIVSEYTRESGLRELERLIAHLARKIARRVVEEAARVVATSAAGSPAVLNPRRPDDRDRGGAGVSGTAALSARGAAPGRRGRHRQRIGLDALRRRGAADRGPDDGRQGLADADRSARRRHEGVGAGGAVVRARPRASARSGQRVLRRARESTSRPPRAACRRTARRPA